jgi:lipopolysaccharide O-acetyltransferase
VVGGRAIVIGARTEIWPQARLEAMNSHLGDVRIRIGDGVVIQPGIHIGAAVSVQIGDGAMIASRVYITDHDHDFRNPDDPAVTNRRVIARPVDIGRHVWLGEGVMVLKGVTLGDHCVIGAGSVVTRDVPPYSVAVGVPARIVSRFDADARRWVRVQGK